MHTGAVSPHGSVGNTQRHTLAKGSNAQRPSPGQTPPQLAVSSQPRPTAAERVSSEQSASASDGASTAKKENGVSRRIVAAANSAQFLRSPVDPDGHRSERPVGRERIGDAADAHPPTLAEARAPDLREIRRRVRIAVGEVVDARIEDLPAGRGLVPRRLDHEDAALREDLEVEATPSARRIVRAADRGKERGGIAGDEEDASPPIVAAEPEAFGGDRLLGGGHDGRARLHDDGDRTDDGHGDDGEVSHGSDHLYAGRGTASSEMTSAERGL